MSKTKQDPRAHIALNMTGDLFMNSTTKFSNLTKLPKLNEVEERLKQRALQAIQSKSPQDRKLSVTKVSQLGTGALWKGLDLVPQRNSKSPGNQQRLQTSANQTTLSPQQQRYQTQQNNTKKQRQLQTHINQNPQKKYIQRNQNRGAQNEVNDSRYHGQTKDVTGNIVSKNLLRNQKSVKDDFAINEKSSDKKRKYSNQNDKLLNQQSSAKNINRNMTQSRAISDAKQKRVSFSPSKPRQHTIQKKQTLQIKPNVALKTSVTSPSKVATIKQQPYVYIPPQKRTLAISQENIHQNHSQSLIPSKNSRVESKIQPRSVPYQSLSPKLQSQKKVVQNVVNKPAYLQKRQPLIKIKSRQEIIAEQQKTKKAAVSIPNQGFVYQPPQVNNVSSQKTIKAEIKNQIVTTNKIQSIEKRTQNTPKKVEFKVSDNTYKKTQDIVKTPRPIINKTVVVEQNIEIKKVTSIIKTPRNNVQHNNVSLDISSISKSPQKNNSTIQQISRKKIEVTAEEMKKDWSKIKSNLKYDRSISPSNSNIKKVPERQDVAMKMLAQIFLNASTRFFPGMSMLLKRGISQQQIDQIRSKSSEFKINIVSIQKKSPLKTQPKSQRKLNWKQNQSDINKQKQNNRMYQGDVTATQYKTKKPEQLIQKKTQISGISKSQIQQKSVQRQKGPNIVTVSLEKNNKKMTRDDLILDIHKREPSERSNSIRESPDIYHRQISKKDVEDSKKDLAKMKIQASKNQPSKKQGTYVYQPPNKKVENSPVASPQKLESTSIQKSNIKIASPIQSIQKPINKQIIKQQPKLAANQLNTSKSQTSITLPTKNQQIKSIPLKPIIKQVEKQPLKSINVSKTSINQSPVKQQKQSIYSPIKKPQTNLNKKQQESGYVYQPPSKRQTKVISPPKQNESLKQIKSINLQPKQLNVSKTQIQKAQVKPSQQLNQSKSTTNIQIPVKPIIIQPAKPIAKIQPKIVQVKPVVPVKVQPLKTQEKKVQPIASQKNISLISSKSQTSIMHPHQQVKKTPIQTQKNKPSTSSYVYQPPNKKDTSTNSEYLYKPSILQKKDNSIGTQPNLPTRKQPTQTLRSVQSEKLIKTIQPVIKQKVPQPIMIKKEHKTVTAETSKVNTQIVSNQLKIKQPTLLSRKLCTLITLVIKKNITSNYSFSLQKIKLQSKIKFELLQHASFLNRSLTTFTHNYQSILKRSCFKLIKNYIVSSVNKIIKENKPIQENNNFSSGRKQSATRIIFFLLKDKLASYLQPLRQKYLSIKNKGKTRQTGLEALVRIYDKRSFIFKKDAFKAVKSYKNQRQAVLKNFANLLGKIKYSAVSQHFSTFVNKDIKTLGAQVHKLKQLPQGSKQTSNSEANKTLSKSKSQQVISSSKLIKQESQNSIQSQKLSPSDEIKLESKKKQLERKQKDLEKRKENLQQQVNDLNKDKRVKTKKNAELKIKTKELQRQIQHQEVALPLQHAKSRQNALNEDELIPVLTRIYAYLFQDSDNTQIIVERFLSDNQHCFQLPTNPALLNEWKVINKNAELKRLVKLFQGEQPRQKRISEILQQQNLLMSKLLRSFVRQRYIWEWVNIIAHQ